jgi:hypothetical protein
MVKRRQNNNQEIGFDSVEKGWIGWKGMITHTHIN